MTSPYGNDHIPTPELRQRVTDLAQAGIPQYMIAKIIKIDDETLAKHYRYDIDTAIPVAVGKIGKIVAIQASEGCTKSQALYLKTQGAKYGFVEKQVIEAVIGEETQALRLKVQELEGKYLKDY